MTCSKQVKHYKDPLVPLQPGKVDMALSATACYAVLLDQGKLNVRVSRDGGSWEI